MLVDKLDDIDIGERVVFDKVLLVGSKVATFVGRPYVLGAHVSALNRTFHYYCTVVN